MKKTVFILITFFTVLTATAQKGARYIQPNDPLVGDWKIAPDSTHNYSAAPIVSGESYLSISPGIEVCMAAKLISSGNGFQSATYFVAKKDAQHIYCSISECYNPKLDGKDISFQYEYKPDTDTLYVIINAKRYRYQRMKS